MIFLTEKSGKAISNSYKSDGCDLEILVQGICIRIVNTIKALERCGILCHNLSQKEFIAKLICVL